jgi:peptidoglycan hydrolase-like protein with peptidoglycan-binding domain
MRGTKVPAGDDLRRVGQNGSVIRATGTARRSIGLVLAVLVGGLTPVAVDGGPARAEIPELGRCDVDAGLGPGATGTGVVCLQFALTIMGTYRGAVTGVYDQATADALAWFQSDHPPLPVDGTAGVSTLLALGVYSGVDTGPIAATCQADAPVLPGNRGPAARCVQQRLADLGLYDGAIDGFYRPATTFAVQQFQAGQEALEPTGRADSRTLAAMGIWSGFSLGDVGIGDDGAPPPAGPWPAGPQPETKWAVTGQGIPYYAGRRACSRADADMIAAQFANDGADIDVQQWAVYIASREGGCDFRTVYVNPATRDDSHCTFQLNALAGMFAPRGELGRRGWTAANVKESMKNCADAASDLWVYCGKGPWTPPYACAPPWKGDLGADGDE